MHTHIFIRWQQKCINRLGKYTATCMGRKRILCNTLLRIFAHFVSLSTLLSLSHSLSLSLSVTLSYAISFHPKWKKNLCLILWWVVFCVDVHIASPYVGCTSLKCKINHSRIFTCVKREADCANYECWKTNMHAYVCTGPTNITVCCNRDLKVSRSDKNKTRAALQKHTPFPMHCRTHNPKRLHCTQSNANTSQRNGNGNENDEIAALHWNSWWFLLKVPWFIILFFLFFFIGLWACVYVWVFVSLWQSVHVILKWNVVYCEWGDTNEWTQKQFDTKMHSNSS